MEVTISQHRPWPSSPYILRTSSIVQKRTLRPPVSMELCRGSRRAHVGLMDDARAFAATRWRYLGALDESIQDAMLKFRISTRKGETNMVTWSSHKRIVFVNHLLDSITLLPRTLTMSNRHYDRVKNIWLVGKIFLWKREYLVFWINISWNGYKKRRLVY